MLLELYVAEDQKRSMSVSELCQASGAAMTTALRYISHFETDGLIRRRTDTRDSRRVFIDPQPSALHIVEAAVAGFFGDGDPRVV